MTDPDRRTPATDLLVEGQDRRPVAMKIGDLHKSFGPTQVLKAIELEVRQGDVISLIGSSGSGYPKRLSCGQQQRVAIARVLAMQPKIMLFDEATSALDPELIGEVLRVIRERAAEGNTILPVTHEMRFARDVSSRVLFLHQGKVLEDDTPEEIFGNPKTGPVRQFLSSMAPGFK